MEGFRYANIGVGAGLLTILLGMVVFGFEDERAASLTVFLGLIVTFAVYHGLDERERRRRGEGDGRRPDQ